MKWIKGIVLLLISNLLFMVAINVIVSFVLPLFGITLGGDTASLLTMASIYGFTGAFLSLAFSKQMARAMLSSCQQITQPRSHVEQMVYGSVQDIARRLNITMPEVWVYESPDPNAFATGPSKNNSMVAVSTGLLQNLKEDEVRAVLAHEMGHVYNGDMFTTTVLVGPTLLCRAGSGRNGFCVVVCRPDHPGLPRDDSHHVAFATPRIRGGCLFRQGLRQRRHDLGVAGDRPLGISHAD